MIPTLDDAHVSIRLYFLVMLATITITRTKTRVGRTNLSEIYATPFFVVPSFDPRNHPQDLQHHPTSQREEALLMAQSASYHQSHGSFRVIHPPTHLINGQSVTVTPHGKHRQFDLWLDAIRATPRVHGAVHYIRPSVDELIEHESGRCAHEGRSWTGEQTRDSHVAGSCNTTLLLRLSPWDMPARHRRDERTDHHWIPSCSLPAQTAEKAFSSVDEHPVTIPEA